ncbi:hypothetical protein [Lentibacillus sp. Marseille-P4043]|uniref:hypothetical protein n=1 Tax=Lentibacillus sp. Marseille-P4043 TaxID=2040293 RepID=UPI00131A5C76|nr:hypothetical protein [Lentibacillus sp. Marseille-P4043]
MADELDINVNVLALDNYEMAQQKYPIPFGVFTVIYNVEIITYHPETKIYKAIRKVTFAIVKYGTIAS